MMRRYSDSQNIPETPNLRRYLENKGNDMVTMLLQEVSLENQTSLYLPSVDHKKYDLYKYTPKNINVELEKSPQLKKNTDLPNLQKWGVHVCWKFSHFVDP